MKRAQSSNTSMRQLLLQSCTSCCRHSCGVPSMAYDALSMAAAGSSSRAPSSLSILLAGLAVGPPLRHASLHSSTSAAACSTYRQCCNSGHSPHYGSPDYEAPLYAVHWHTIKLPSVQLQETAHMLRRSMDRHP